MHEYGRLRRIVEQDLREFRPLSRVARVQAVPEAVLVDGDLRGAFRNQETVLQESQRTYRANRPSPVEPFQEQGDCRSKQSDGQEMRKAIPDIEQSEGAERKHLRLALVDAHNVKEERNQQQEGRRAPEK